MIKFNTSEELGGAPIFKNDLRTIFNTEIWDVIEAMLSPFDNDVEGIVLTGCEVVDNAGNFDIAPGIVYLNGECMRFPGALNRSFTKYIEPLAPIPDSRTFQNGDTHAVQIESNAQLVTGLPGSGQYLKIASLTDLDDRRWSNIITNKQVASQFQSTVEALGGFRTIGSGVYVKTKIINIGDWNMDSTASISVAHGLGSSWVKIVGCEVMILDDTPALLSNLMHRVNSADATSGDYDIDSTSINLRRVTGGWYDNAPYDATPYNRGFIKITYTT